VILNCPSSVDDSASELIGKLVDHTVFVLNTESTRAKDTNLLRSYIEEDKFNGISMILNRKAE